MKILHLLRLGAFVAADKRLDRKEIDLRKLEKEYEEEDDMELEDLDMWDDRKPKQGMDTRKLDGRDHITTWSEAKKGQQLGMYVNTVPGLSEEELKNLFDLWQMNMINCCNFELTFLPLEEARMLVLLPDGKHLLDFGTMLRQDERCYTFVVENTHMLCAGHPEWDPKRPGKNVEAIEKWDKYHADKKIEDTKKKVEGWKESIPVQQKKIEL